MTTPVDPQDIPFVNRAVADAQAGDTYEQDFEAAQGYAPDPQVPAAISAGQSISVTGVNPLTEAVVAGSATAGQIVQAYSVPLVGAGVPTQQSLAQLSTRFDGVATGLPDKPFPTAQ